MLWIFIGLTVGAIGNIAGVGGGILLVPLLMQMRPDWSVTEITAISLFCVMVNALSGSIQSHFRGLINYRRALVLALAGWPGVILGSWLTTSVGRHTFDLVYALLLMLMATYLWRRGPRVEKTTLEGAPLGQHKKYFTILLGFGIGLFAGFFGVGGGIFYVPLLIGFFHLPVRQATATSTFVLFLSAAVASVQHIGGGSLLLNNSMVVFLALGMVVGAQVGGVLAQKMATTWILRLLNLIIFLTGVKLLWGVLGH